MITVKYALSGMDLKAYFTNCSLLKRVAESLHTHATTAVNQQQVREQICQDERPSEVCVPDLVN